MAKEIEIPEGYEARIEGNKVIFEKKKSRNEEIRDEIINYLNFAESHNLLRAGEYKKKKEWIAYLEKQKEQQSAEWSEEDEQWLESIIKDYEDSLVKDKDHAAVIKIKIDFLKSHRPQPHWKPSEEQMEALKDAFRKDGGNEYRKVINSLYRDLEKLL